MNLLPRKEFTRSLEIPGAITPYYREIFTKHEENSNYPGMNTNIYILFALRTRIEHEKKTSRWLQKNSGKAVLTRYHHQDVMRYFLTLNRVCEPVEISDKIDRKITAETYIPLGNKNTETVTPKWLQKKVNLWTEKHKDYVAILSDRYPISDLPDYWLNQILPRFNISEIVERSIFPEDQDLVQLGNLKPRDTSGYDWFIEDGVFFVRLVDPDSDNNSGPSTPLPGDMLVTGEPAIIRSEEYYGDYARFQSRYFDLQYNIVQELKNMYKSGYIVLDPTLDKELIKNWNLIEHPLHVNIFLPNWKDNRITDHDGIFNFLRRQSLEWKSQWDYQFTFVKIFPGDIVKHNISRWYLKTYLKISLFLNDLIILQFKTLNETVEILNIIEKISTESFGNVEISTGKINYLSSEYLSELNFENKGIFIDFSFQKIPLITKKINV